MPDESVTVKGSPVRSLQKFIDANLDNAQRERVFAALPPEFARYKTPVLATESVPVTHLNRLTEEAAKARGEDPEAFARRAGKEAAREAVKGIYRFFAMVLTPPALLGRASQMWSTLYNKGELRVEEQSSNGAKLRLANFPSERVGCARITGWILGMTELTGVKEPRVTQSACFAKGAKACEWTLEWK